MILALWTISAQAKSWCASPLYVHEWGVQVLRADGHPPYGVALPSWFHRGGSSPGPGERVRDLPADGGERDLPVVQWYAPVSREIPVALEVGFRLGEASAWWPAVDTLRPASQARSVEAQKAHEALVNARASRKAALGGESQPALSSDPTLQLDWEHLDLLEANAQPTGLAQAEVPWVDALRAMPGARWVKRGSEVDRFVFYDAKTTEHSAITLSRGESWGPGRQHIILHNTGDWTVYDVVLVADGQVVTVPAIPAGATAGFLLQDELHPDKLLEWLQGRWVDQEQPDAPTTWSMDMDECAMMRDPSLPATTASGHRLYTAEVKLLLDVWGDRLVKSEGVHLAYREDVQELDALVPLAAYTDMYHTLEVRRLGVVLVEGMRLP